MSKENGGNGNGGKWWKWKWWKMVEMEMVENGGNKNGGKWWKRKMVEMVGASIAGPPREQHHLPPVSFHCLHNWELLSAVKEGFAERQNTNSKQL